MKPSRSRPTWPGASTATSGRPSRPLAVLATALGLLLLTSGCGTSQPSGAYAYPGTVVAGAPDPGFPATASGVHPPAVFELDQRVHSLIREALKADPATAQAARGVHVTITKGVARLRGTVPTEAARQLVVDKVGQVPGVDGVQDELVVR